jgi:hypothetical protein
MKQLFTVILLVISLIATAQNSAKPSNIDGKDIYVLLVNTTPSEIVGNVNLSQEQMAAVTNFESRIQSLLNKATGKDFDAITTRDGNSAQLIKYKTTKTLANVPNYFGKEVYFFSVPTKKYIIKESKEITENDLKQPFYSVAANYSKNDNEIYDAVIISGNKAEYIKYK